MSAPSLLRVEPRLVAVDPDDDGPLLARFRSGERAAFDELVKRHQRGIFLLALRYLGQIEDARDVAQRAFVQAYQQLAAFRGEARFRTWIYRIAANLAMDALRRRGRDQRLSSAVEREPEPASDPDRVSERQEHDRLRAAVAGLPPRQRLVVELRVFQELSFREVAEVVDSSEEAAKMNFHHALKTLRIQLQEEDGT